VKFKVNVDLEIYDDKISIEGKKISNIEDLILFMEEKKIQSEIEKILNISKIIETAVNQINQKRVKNDN